MEWKRSHDQIAQWKAYLDAQTNVNEALGEVALETASSSSDRRPPTGAFHSGPEVALGPHPSNIVPTTSESGQSYVAQSHVSSSVPDKDDDGDEQYGEYDDEYEEGPEELGQDEDENDDDDEDEMEISEEMKAFRKKTEKHRRELKATREAEARRLAATEIIKKDEERCAPPSEQPGARRTAEMKQLYGRRAATIHGMETAVQLSFHRNCDYFQPKLWPYLAIRLQFE